MAERFGIRLQRVAVALAEERSFPGASARLNCSPNEVEKQLALLEELLCLPLFQQRYGELELTEEGQFLIRLFQTFISRRYC